MDGRGTSWINSERSLSRSLVLADFEKKNKIIYLFFIFFFFPIFFPHFFFKKQKKTKEKP